ncbi:MAG: ABC transporter ATP-binding protein, partial [Granulicatella sp.]|nr:ABC transporter ATP-binding protein [Granulicatella sp.]
MFEVKGIEKRYNNKTILHNISFEIPESNITVILGKNGAGKTTLIKLMLGMISADKGDILFKGENLSDIGHSYYKNVSAVLESVDNVYPFLTGKQNIEYFLGLSKQSINYMNGSIQALIDEFELRDAMDEPVGGYSRGMLQKLSLIIALMTNAKVLFLDEPTLGLDFQSSKQLCQKIKQLSTEQHKTIILTSHQAEIIELLADYVIVIDDGAVVYK